MPYQRNSDLPKGVKSLPAAAQTIFRKIANAALQQYGDVPERVMAVAWAGLERAGWKKDEKTGKWHQVREAEDLTAEAQQPDEQIDAWLDRSLDAILAAPDDEADESTHMEGQPLAEADHPRHALRHATDFLSCEMCEFTTDERDMLARMVSRFARETARDDDEDGREASIAYQEQGPRLAQAAYRALLAVSPSLNAEGCEGLPSMLEALKVLVPEDTDLTALADVTPEQVKESLEALKVWDLRMTEQGSRHASWEYELIDSLIEGLKKLRGMSPAEQRAATEEVANSPEALMQQGYRESAPMAETPVIFQESTIILRERAGSHGAEWDVQVIEAGLSKNDRMYSLDVLKRAVPLFEGARIYAYRRLWNGQEIFDHLSDAEMEAHPGGFARDLVGFLKSPRIVGSALHATLHILDGQDWLRKNLLDAFAHNRSDLYQLSIDARGSGHVAESGGREILHVDSIDHVHSVDIVTYGAAGGSFMRLVAGVNVLAQEHHVESALSTLTKQLQDMQFRQALEEAMDEAELPVGSRRRFRMSILAAVPQ